MNPQYRPDAGEPALRRKNPLRWFVPAMCGKRRCRMHGGASAGAPKLNRNALRHGLFTGDAIDERKRIQDPLADARELLLELK